MFTELSADAAGQAECPKLTAAAAAAAAAVHREEEEEEEGSPPANWEVQTACLT